MLEMVFEFPQGLPRRPKNGDILKEKVFKYEVISSSFWNNRYLVYARPVGLALVWFTTKAYFLILTNQFDGNLK